MAPEEDGDVDGSQLASGISPTPTVLRQFALTSAGGVVTGSVTIASVALASLAHARRSCKLAVEEFQQGNRQIAIQMLEAAKRVLPQEVSIYFVLGQLCWYTDDRAGSIENFSEVLKIDSDHKTANRFWDLLFFVAEEFEVPQLLVTGHFRIRPLRAADVDLDYRAVMGSIDHLKGVFGPDDDWPTADLTREDDLRALRNHEKEHAQRSAFTYTVMNHEESEILGCVYILPIHTDEFDAQIFFWVTKDAYDRGLDAALHSDIEAWLREDWPFGRVVFPGRDMDWETYTLLVG